MQIKQEIKTLGSLVEARLDALLNLHCEHGTLKEAMRYSLMAGGKRLRPVLCLFAARLFGDENKALDVACALEMIHTYSLIHDDLPAMDDDNLRRGKPTNHVVFDEATAILAGDGLLNLAFEVMLAGAVRDAERSLEYINTMNIIAQAAGVRGMIAGQVADMQSEGKEPDEDILRNIHERKTAAMVKASVLSGAVLLGANDDDIAALETYGQNIGLVFQIVDDVLDEVGDADRMGKTLGKDSGAGKQTFARLYGIEASRCIAEEKTDEAILALTRFGSKAQNLADLAKLLRDRDR